VAAAGAISHGRIHTRTEFDYGLLVAVSVLAHVCVWLWFQQPAPPSVPVVTPRVVELSLVRPAPPPVVQPPPPPQAVAAPQPPPPPKPKPKPKPKPAPKPKLKPLPPLEPPPVQPVTPPPSAVPAPVALPNVPVAPAAPPVFVAATRASSTRNPKPEYPMIAKRRGWEGTVSLLVEVGSDGKPTSVKVRESSGRALLDQSALRTVKLWLFNPATRDGKPVDSTMTVSIVFKLENR